MDNNCINCGLCCKIIPTINGKIYRDGEQCCESYFEPITLDEAKNINKVYVERILDIIPIAEFLTCTYMKNNVCTNPNLDSNCKNFPQTALAIVPDECAFVGKVFIENEKLKQKIRKLKEEMINYESLVAIKHEDSNGYKKIISNLQARIDKYKLYGSENW